VTFSINRGIGIGENSLDEFIEMLKDAFILNNIHVVSEKTLKTGEMEGYVIICETPDLSILIITSFKLYDRINIFIFLLNLNYLKMPRKI
jgi:hypothetical protein